MRRTSSSRRHLVGVLRRPPSLVRSGESASTSAVLRGVDGVREMLDLVDRGLLSAEEFDRQQEKRREGPD